MHLKSFTIVCLFRFMRLFGASLFSLLSATDSQISAVVAWADDCRKGFPDYDDMQEILWHIPQMHYIDDALRLGELMYDNGWILSDRITVSKSTLQDEIKWENEKLCKALEALLALKVSMVDDGEETDAFFLHF